MRAVRMHRFGGPEVLQVETVPTPTPGPGEVLVRVRAAGLNHVDIDIREGLSRFDFALPHIPGIEAAGEVAELGAGVSGVQVGDRVAVSYTRTCGRCEYCRVGMDNLCLHRRVFGEHIPGSYAEYMLAPADHCLPLPEGLSFDAAAASMVAFGTAWHALMARADLRAGETVLIHSVGSGVASAALQIAKLAGATAIVTAGHDAKLARAAELGADHGINYRSADPFERVMQLTGGRGVDLVFDVVGGEVFTRSLAVLRPHGRLLSIGAHAREVVPFDIVKFFLRPITLISSHTQTRQELAQLLALLSAGRLQPLIDRIFPLAEAAEAQRYMERREHFGKILLHP